MQGARSNLEAGALDMLQQTRQLVGRDAVSTHAAGQLHDDSATPTVECIDMVVVADGEHGIVPPRRDERGGEHHWLQPCGDVVQLVDVADGHQRGPSRGDGAVQHGTAQAVAIALHHRDEPMAIRVHGCLHVRIPGGALDGESHGHQWQR